MIQTIKPNKKESKKMIELKVFFFCEDCGEKNFQTLELPKKDKKDQQVRCQACNYLNTVTPPPEEK